VITDVAYVDGPTKLLCLSYAREKKHTSCVKSFPLVELFEWPWLFGCFVPVSSLRSTCLTLKTNFVFSLTHTTMVLTANAVTWS
jgi:hypothetical protein